MAGYFTDSTSMSGLDTDVSTDDDSDEESSVEGVCINLDSARITVTYGSDVLI